MGTSNSDRFASSSGIFLGLDPRIGKDQTQKEKEDRWGSEEKDA
jgi:hypothetical protein